MLLSLFGFLSLLGFVGIIVFLVMRGWSLYQKRHESQYQRSRDERTGESTTNPKQDNLSIEKKSFRRLILTMVPIAVILLAISTICFSGAYIGPVEYGVVENGFNGQISAITEGVHFWPKDKNLVPFASKVTKYDLRQIEVTVGQGAVANETTGIEARSTSPGNPKIYFIMRALIQIEPDAVLTIHRQYGTNYRQLWVEKSFVSAIKTVQGGLTYDSVYDRKGMEDKIKAAFAQKMFLSGIQAIKIAQVDIVDYNFEQSLDQLLTEIKNKEFERQTAEKLNQINLVKKDGELEVAKRQLEINQNQQNADKIKADTIYYNTTKDGEALAENVRKSGVAQADNVREMGFAEAETIKSKKLAEAEGLLEIVKSLSQAGPNFVWYNAFQAWKDGGQIPNIVTIGGSSDTLQFTDLYSFMQKFAPSTTK